MLAIKNKGKKAVALDFLFWLILGVIVLVIIVLIIMILTGKGSGAIEYIKDLFRWSFVCILINKPDKLINSNPKKLNLHFKNYKLYKINRFFKT